MSYYTQTENTRNELLGLNFNGRANLSLYEIKGNHMLTVNVNNCGKFDYKVNEWDAESYDILESILWEGLYSGNLRELRDSLKSYGASPCDAHALEGAWVGGNDKEQKKTYCKASKIRGKEKIDTHVINGLIKKIGLSIDYLKTISNFDFQKTSAILYKGIYVCPVSLEYELIKILGITKAEAKIMAQEILRGE